MKINRPWIAAATVLVASCGGGGDANFKQLPESESPAKEHQAEEPAAPPDDDKPSLGPTLKDIPLPDKLFHAKYAVRVTAPDLDDFEVCTGVVDLTVKSNFTFDLGDSTMNCMDLCEVKLANAMGLFMDTKVQAKLKLITHKKSPIVYVDELLDSRYQPPRPLTISPFAGKRSEYGSLHKSVSLKASSPTSSGSGTIALDVLGVDEPYTPPNSSLKFKKTLRFRTTANGFEGFDRGKFGLIDNLEMRYGLEPFGVPQIKVLTKIGSVINTRAKLDSAQATKAAKLCSGALGQLGGELAGPVIDLVNSTGDSGLFGGLLKSIQDYAAKVRIAVSVDLLEMSDTGTDLSQ